MKTLSIIAKSLKEQIRSYWVLLLLLSMGPFFILVYFLITETSKEQYDILIVNNDKGITINDQKTNHGKDLIDYYNTTNIDFGAIPFTVTESNNRNNCIAKIKNKEADALIIIDSLFTQSLKKLKKETAAPKVEFIGDLTNTNYLISAVWANEMLNEFFIQTSNGKRLVEVKETALGSSGNISDFDMLVPGILIVSLIMLMFTASIAFVSEVENKTIMRLKLSKITNFEFLAGISFVQLLIGVSALLLTLLTAIMLGFHFSGSLWIMIFIASLTSLSIISFSLIISAITKSANEVLIVGNFPMFLFMFFTGAAFPLKSKALLTIAGYPINFQSLLSPSHAISALNKTLIMDMSIISIVPEITSIIFLSIIYFLLGAIIFKRRHLKLA